MTASPSTNVVLAAEACLPGAARLSAVDLWLARSAVRDLPWSDLRCQPFRGSFFDDDDLPPLHRKVQRVEEGSLAARLLRLAGVALRSLDVGRPSAPLRIVLGLSHPGQLGRSSPESFLDDLMRQAQVRLDVARSELVFAGIGGSPAVLERASELLRAQPDAPLVVGAVDSLIDLPRLVDQDFARARGERGELPPAGEAAALLHLAAPGRTSPACGVHVVSVAAGGAATDMRSLEQGFSALSRRVQVRGPLGCVYAALSRPASEELACRALCEQLSPWPFEPGAWRWATGSYGDVGAASGLLGAALAWRGLSDHDDAAGLGWSMDMDGRSSLNYLTRDERWMG